MKKTRNLLTLAMVGALLIWVTSAANTTVTHNPDAWVSYTLNWNENFTAWTITISDWTTTITMLDRNLWATKAGTGCEDPNWNCPAYAKYYWYHFQWWNNYWFYPNNIASISPNQTQTPIVYNPFYTKWVFIIWHKNWLTDNWVADLWWWDINDNTYNLNDDTWKIKKNPRKRQWPCPEWFHVPSKWELDKIKNMMWDDMNAIHNELLIPFAGYSDYHDAVAKDLGKDAHLWSSTPHALTNPHSRMLDLVDGLAIVGSDYRAHGYSIRCVYDQYDNYSTSPSIPWKVDKYTITFVDWSGIEKSVIWEWEYGTKTNWKIDFPKRTKTGYTLSWLKKIPDTVPAENIVIIAIWTKNLTTNNWWQPTIGNWNWWSNAVKILQKDKNDNSTKDCINWKCTDNNSIQKAHNSSTLSIEETTKFDTNINEEMNEKYQYTYKNNTTTESINKSDINTWLVNTWLVKTWIVKTAIVNTVNILWKNLIQQKYVNLITWETYQMNNK